ncbi:hypothetical protein HMPREF0168_2242 [Bifidobacterium dentium ATCC 27679]|uniref:Uncharacterized protein n=1 Tax=Bifidobacterium dentium ATCC 27679 TaxID=871562 RepID=E0QAT4_9BIFI|nr:hypothetical protein HMPREF0168_2242 [Bifidobacterium dentium ATCC 27679]
MRNREGHAFPPGPKAASPTRGPDDGDPKGTSYIVKRTSYIVKRTSRIVKSSACRRSHRPLREDHAKPGRRRLPSGPRGRLPPPGREHDRRPAGPERGHDVGRTPACRPGRRFARPRASDTGRPSPRGAYHGPPDARIVHAPCATPRPGRPTVMRPTNRDDPQGRGNRPTTGRKRRWTTGRTSNATTAAGPYAGTAGTNAATAMPPYAATADTGAWTAEAASAKTASATAPIATNPYAATATPSARTATNTYAKAAADGTTLGTATASPACPPAAGSRTIPTPPHGAPCANIRTCSPSDSKSRSTADTTWTG